MQGPVKKLSWITVRGTWTDTKKGKGKAGRKCHRGTKRWRKERTSRERKERDTVFYEDNATLLKEK